MGVWNMLTLEQLRQLGDEEVTQLVNERLVPLGVPTQGLYIQPADFLAAQYYVSELDRREVRRENEERDRIETVRRRIDLGLELLIVVLIGIEILLAIGSDRQRSNDAALELKAFSEMQVVLSHLQDTSKATADTMKDERQIMEGMKTSLDRQVALFYDVQLNVVYNESTKRLVLINAGRTNVALYEASFSESQADTKKFAKPQLIAPSSTQEFELEKTVEALSKEIPKGQQRTFAFAFLVKNEKQQPFTLSGDLIALWRGDVLWFATQPSSIVPGWTK